MVTAHKENGVGLILILHHNEDNELTTIEEPRNPSCYYYNTRKGTHVKHHLTWLSADSLPKGSKQLDLIIL